MLKFFYKIILVSFLSGSLLLMDFNYKGQGLSWNNARAESVKMADTEGGMNMMATLTMVVVGVLASRLYKYKMTLDIGLATAGAVAFISGDIIAFLKNKEVMKDLEKQIVRDEKGNIDQKQIDSFVKLKKSYMAAKDTATTKKMLQMAAAAAFAGAGIAAFTMATTEEAAQAQCMLGLKAAVATAFVTDEAVCTQLDANFVSCNTPCPEASLPAAVLACEATCITAFKVPATTCHATTKACKAKIGTDMALFTKYIVTRETPKPSIPALLEDTTQSNVISSVFPKSVGVCTPYGAKMLAAETIGNCPAAAMLATAQASGGPPPTIVGSNQQQIKKFIFPHLHFQAEESEKSLVENSINKVSDFFFSKANAVGILDALGIAADQAIEYVVATSQSLSTTLDLSLLIPKRRAIVWGVLSALSLASSMATGSEITKIEGNIAKIDAILNSMNSLQNGVGQANNLAATKPVVDLKSVQNNPIGLNQNMKMGINPNKPGNYDLVANGGSPLPCVTGSDSANCQSLSQKMVGLNALDSMPAFAQSQVGNITKLADGLSGASSLSGSTLELSKNLAGQQNALSLELKKQQLKLQNKLRSLGSKIDLASESNKLEASMRAIVKKGLDGRKTTAAAMYASFGGASSGSTGSSTPSIPANDTSIKSKNAYSNGGGVAPAYNPYSKDSSLENSETATLAAPTDNAIANSVDAKGKSAPSIDDYILGNDITQDKDTSIFNLISKRYKKSGYPRLFKEIK